MSKQYYSIQTGNKFAGLNLDSDHGEILASKPAELIAREEAEAEAAQADAAAKKTDRRVNRGTGGNAPDKEKKPRAPRGDKTEGQRKPAAGKDYEAQGDDRENRRRRFDSKAEGNQRNRSEGRRDGQKTLDRRGGQPKAVDDTDPTHEVQDAEGAEVDVAADEAARKYSERKVPDEPEEPEIIKTTVRQHREETAASQYVVKKGEDVTKYEDLEKEMSEAGFKALPVTVSEPNRAAKEKQVKKAPRTGVLSLAELGNLPKLGVATRPRNDYKDVREPREARSDSKKDAKADSPTDELTKKKAYRDLEIFPNLE